MRFHAVNVKAPHTAHITGTATSVAAACCISMYAYISTSVWDVQGRSACAAISMRLEAREELDELKRTVRLVAVMGTRKARRASIVYVVCVFYACVSGS
jgi:hypothetical protein